MWPVIAIVLFLAIVVFVIAVLRQPGDFRIVRTTTVLAPASTVFALVNDFHNWQHWSPWAHRDPAMMQSFEGPSSGVGAGYRWAGNKEVGEGAMTIVDSDAPELIRIRLEFFKPFKATNTAEFTFKPEEGRTQVSWSMAGCSNFMSRAFCMFVDMDKMVGRDFEKGLVDMKRTAEAAA